MKLKKIKLGKLIELVELKNSDEKLKLENVRGISTQKFFIETKANMEGVPLKGYKIVPPKCFAYVPDTSRRGDKISLAYNDSNESYLVSSITVIFKVKSELLSSEYLFMFFNRPEFDRYSRYNSFGSAREPFNWSDMCDIDFELPPIEIQKKFVAIYKNMVANQKAYEQGLDDLKLTCDAFIEKIRQNNVLRSIIDYIKERTETNKDGAISFMKGVGLKGFINPNQDRSEQSLKKCNIFYKGDFVYAPSSFKNGVISYNDEFDKAICSEEYIVFTIKNIDILDPYYLLMWLKREQLGRFIDFASCDSVRNRFYFEDLKIIEIPIPDIMIQRKVSNLYQGYLERMRINNQLKDQIKRLCPILIKGAIKEAEEQ